ncbi:MAG TPA: NUDIX domain-containing protein [Nocardioidaceae bacterium]|nr:NUDIX domain-containing protein [Nocardioidaceae bacterium]
MRPRIDCVGGIVKDEAGRLLLVRRGHEPSKGLWSVPGGRVEAGESDVAAVRREVLEETALPVVVGDLAGTVERAAPADALFVIRDYLCSPAPDSAPDQVVAGDDADDVGWFTAAQITALACTPDLVDVLVEWGVLPATT